MRLYRSSHGQLVISVDSDLIQLALGSHTSAHTRNKYKGIKICGQLKGYDVTGTEVCWDVSGD